MPTRYRIEKGFTMMNFDSVGATMNDDNIMIILIGDDSEKTTHLTKPFIFKKLQHREVPIFCTK